MNKMWPAIGLWDLFWGHTHKFEALTLGGAEKTTKQYNEFITNALRFTHQMVIFLEIIF